MDPVADTAEPSYPKRSLRLPGLFDGRDPFYFVTFNTYDRSRVLARHEVHRAFVDFCEKATNFHIHVGRYVLMPDHIHLIVMMPDRNGQSLNAWIKALKSVFGKVLLASDVEKPHWQEGYFDHVLRSNESYRKNGDYIFQNPVRAGLCQHPEDWLFRGEIVVL